MPPPPPPPRRGSPTNGSNRPLPPPPPPPPKRNPQPHVSPFMASSSPAVSMPQSYESYGEIPSKASTTHRRNVPVSQHPVPSFAYGIGTTSSSAVPSVSSYNLPSSYPTPKPLKTERQSSATVTKELQYEHNYSALAFLLPTLLSIIWWHESPALLQTLLIMGLILYGLDMANARDAMAVVTWLSALSMTLVSGFVTFLQVDESDATGSGRILYVVLLAVEGMFFCTLVSYNSSKVDLNRYTTHLLTRNQ